MCMLASVHPASADAVDRKPVPTDASDGTSGSADYLSTGCYINIIDYRGNIIALWIGYYDSTLPNGGCPAGAGGVTVTGQYRVGNPSSSEGNLRIMCGTPVATPYGNGYWTHAMDTSLYGEWGCPFGDVHMEVI